MKRLLLALFFCVGVCQAQTVTLQLDAVPLVDFVKLVYGEIGRREFLLSSSVLDAKQPITMMLRDETPARVVEYAERLLKDAGFTFQQRNGVAWIDAVKPDPEPDDEIIVYRPRHRSANYLSDVVQPLTGAKSLLSRNIRQQEQVHQQQPATTSTAPVVNQKQSAQREGEPTSASGKIDRGEVDQIAFSISSKDAGKLRKLLADLDTPAGEVLLKAAVYEVGTTKEEGSAIKLALSLSGITAAIGGSLSSGASIKLTAGGLEALFSALDSDTRFKSMSRPQVRVKNGATARFSVGQDVPVLGSQQIDRNGNPLQSIEYKQSGIILTAKPEIREDVIELDLQQEISSFVVTSTGVNGSPTLTKRSVSSRMTLTPGEVVILAGLQSDSDDGQNDRVPFLGWLIGNSRKQQQSEILVFIEAVKI